MKEKQPDISSFRQSHMKMFAFLKWSLDWWICLKRSRQPKKNSFFLIWYLLKWKKNNQMLMVFLWVLFQHNFALELKTPFPKDVFGKFRGIQICHQLLHRNFWRSSERCLVDGTVIPKLLGDAWSFSRILGRGGIQGGNWGNLKGC